MQNKKMEIEGGKCKIEWKIETSWKTIFWPKIFLISNFLITNWAIIVRIYFLYLFHSSMVYSNEVHWGWKRDEEKCLCWSVLKVQ